MKEPRNIIVIGGSAGGIKATSKLISHLPSDIDAAILVVIHLAKKSNGSIITGIFQKHTTLDCTIATDGAKIEAGTIYLAPPEHQMMLIGNTIHINQGPRENKYRPSIDVLFRSAGVYFGNRVIGIILTGMLDDGTSGMSAIQRSGGICIVQDPDDAEHSDMPQSVINQVPIHYKTLLNDFPVLIRDIMQDPLPPAAPIPEELMIEAKITQNMMSNIDELKKIADHSDFTCPECGGGLWAVRNDPMHRYRCHTGHVYTERMLKNEQSENIEESIWVSIRMLEERRNLLSLMATHALEAGNISGAANNQHQLEEINKHVNRLKKVLTLLTEDMEEE